MLMGLRGRQYAVHGCLSQEGRILRIHQSADLVSWSASLLMRMAGGAQLTSSTVNLTMLAVFVWVSLEKVLLGGPRSQCSASSTGECVD